MEILSSVIALLSLVVTYIVYKNNTLAEVVVYAQADLQRPSIINLVIHNIGNGIARDIMFNSTDGIPTKAYGITALNAPKEVYTSGAWVTGLPILLPDEKLVYSWGQFGGLRQALNNEPLEIEVSYTSRLATQLWKKRITHKMIVDVACFEGISIAESFFQVDLKKSLSDIAKSIQNLK